MQSILKVILIAVASGIICYIGWTVYGEGTQPAAAGMSQAVQMAQTQSQNVGNALASVNAISVPATGIVDPPPSNANPPPNSVNPPGSVAPPNGNVPGRLDERLTPRPIEISEITDLHSLLAEWEPRYEMSKLAYAKFSASIANAKSRAAEYFAQQKTLTASMRDPANRARAEEEDDAELLLYKQWEARADLALRKTREIGIQLDDMNTDFQKMKLRQDFVFDASTFQETPKAIQELNEQLADFQTSSEYIKTIVDSPFQARRQ